MSVLIADYTLVVRKQAIDEKYPGGSETYVQALRGLEPPPRFVCSSDAHLVNASFATPDGIAKASIWSSMFGIGASPTSGPLPDLACVDQIVGPNGQCDWLEWRRDSSVATCAWLAGTDPGEIAAPDGWVPREHCVIEETLAQVVAQADADANARRAAMDVVRATLDQLDYPYSVSERTGTSVGFAIETEVDRYVVAFVTGDEGSISCTCAPMVARPVHHVAKLGLILRAANRDARRYMSRIVLQLTEFDGRVGCSAIFVPDEVTESAIEFVLDATLDLADEVQTVLTNGRKPA